MLQKTNNAPPEAVENVFTLMVSFQLKQISSLQIVCVEPRWASQPHESAHRNKSNTFLRVPSVSISEQRLTGGSHCSGVRFNLRGRLLIKTNGVSDPIFNRFSVCAQDKSKLISYLCR